MTKLRKIEHCPVCEGEGWHFADDLERTATRCPKVTGARAETSGMDAARYANETAFDHALRLIEEAARSNAEVDANLLREVFDLADIPQPVRGAAFAKAARDGIIRAIGRHPSTQESTHGHGIARYASRIYKPGSRRAS